MTVGERQSKIYGHHGKTIHSKLIWGKRNGAANIVGLVSILCVLGAVPPVEVGWSSFTVALGGAGVVPVFGWECWLAIPMRAGVDSLNVAAAAAVALWELRLRS